MAEDTWSEPRARRWWTYLPAAEYIRARATPGRLAWGLTLGIFSLTLLVYYLTYSSSAVHNHPIRLADAFLHGRLDIENGKGLIGFLDFAIYKDKYYPLEPPGSAIVSLPGVLLFGLDINQTLISLVIGSITAALVFQLVRRLTESVAQQLLLTVMFSFGSVYWWNSTFAGVWYFNHAVAVLFLFFAVYETLVSKRPFTAGLALGFAYITRLPTIMTFPFFLVMFTQWRSGTEGQPTWKRLDYQTLIKLGLGVGIFVAALSLYTFVRFDDVRPSASYYHWHALPSLQVPGGVLDRGLFDLSYMPRHVEALFEQPLYMTSADAPYVLPRWGGTAFWVTTPAFLYAFLAGIANRWIRWLGAASMVLSVTFVSIIPNLGRGPSTQPWFDWAQWDIPYNVNLLPFILLAGYSMYRGFKGNKIILGSWLAILFTIPIHFTVGVTGWPQFGYRYLLDYVPFVFLLTWLGMGPKLKWHHVAMVSLGVFINLMGVLYVNKFDANRDVPVLQPVFDMVRDFLIPGWEGIHWITW